VNTKIAFFGTSEFGEIVREKLKAAGFQLVDPGSPQVDLIVVAFYGKILSKKELEIPTYGALNVHPSLLPKYRGPTPIPTTILNGDTETGVTIIQMDEEVDHGPIVVSKKFEIGNKEFTTPELRKVLWELGGDPLVEVIPKWVAGEIIPQEQEHDKATYTEKLTREDGKIDWSKPTVYIERQVRAFYPWPGAFTFWKDKRVKILKAHVAEEKAFVLDS